MATMKQIAQMAGVSRGTVDRVLNGRGAVSEETERRVREVAQSLNYVPSRAARSLAALKKGIRLGFVYPSGDNPFFEQVLEGVRKKTAELEAYGASVVVRTYPFSDIDGQNRVIDELVGAGVQGIALCGVTDPGTNAKIDALWEQKIPVVTVNSDIPSSKRIAYVGSDYVQSGRTAGNLAALITGGPAKVGVVYGAYNILCHIERINGFRAYLQEHAPRIRIEEVIENADDDFESFAGVRDMLREHPDIGLLFLTSAGVYGSCRAVEMLPEDKRPQIICFDAVPRTIEMMGKGIVSATICQQPDYQGSKPLDILFNYIAAGTRPSRELYITQMDIRIAESVQS